MERLRVAFAEFRERGFWARISQDGGLMAVPEDLIRRCGKYVFWHENETPLAFGPDGMLKKPLHMRHFIKYEREIFEVLEEQFGQRVFIDRTPLGGVVVNPLDLEPLEEEVNEHHYAIGKKYIIPTPFANEWYIAQASAGSARLVADDADGIWLTLPWRALTQQMVIDRVKEVAAA
jgi:hypothetical protein